MANMNWNKLSWAVIGLLVWGFLIALFGSLLAGVVNAITGFVNGITQSVMGASYFGSISLSLDIPTVLTLTLVLGLIQVVRMYVLANLAKPLYELTAL